MENKMITKTKNNSYENFVLIKSKYHPTIIINDDLIDTVIDSIKYKELITPLGCVGHLIFSVFPTFEKIQLLQKYKKLSEKINTNLNETLISQIDIKFFCEKKQLHKLLRFAQIENSFLVKPNNMFVEVEFVGHVN